MVVVVAVVAVVVAAVARLEAPPGGISPSESTRLILTIGHQGLMR